MHSERDTIIVGVSKKAGTDHVHPYLKYYNADGREIEWIGKQCKMVDQAFLIAMQKQVELKRSDKA